MYAFLGGFRLFGLACLPWWGWPIDRTTQKKVSFFLSSLLGSTLYQFPGFDDLPNLRGNRQTKGRKTFKAKLGFWEGVSLVGCPIPYPSIPSTKPKPQTIGQKKRPQNGVFSLLVFLWN
jgi:hypothetical protein